MKYSYPKMITGVSKYALAAALLGFGTTAVLAVEDGDSGEPVETTPEPVEISVLPSNGDEIAVEALESTLIFYGEGNTEIKPNWNDELSVTLTNSKGIELTSWSAAEVNATGVYVDSEGNTTSSDLDDATCIGYKLNLAEHITAPGKYTLTIPAGFFSVTVADGEFANNKELVATYTVFEPTTDIMVLPDDSELLSKVALKETKIYADGREIIMENRDDLFITFTNSKGTQLASFNYEELREGAITEGEGEDAICIGYQIDLEEYITADGIYTLRIPAGFFSVKCEGVDEYSLNNALTLSYAVVEPYQEIRILPADGDEVSFEAIDQVMIFYGEGNNELMPSNDDTLFVTLTNKKGIELQKWSADEMRECAVTEGEGDDAVVTGYKLDLSDAIVSEGYYTLTVPKGFFTITTDEGSYPQNEAISSTFLVWSPTTTIEVWPEDTELLSNQALEETRIWAGGREIILENRDDLFITFNNGKGIELGRFSAEEVREGAMYDGEGDDAICVAYEINLSQFITADGVYTLNIPAGFFSVKSDEIEAYPTNEALTMTYYVVAPYVTLSVLPASGDVINSEALEKTEIFFGQGQNEVMPTHKDDLFITLTNAKGTVLCQWGHNEMADLAVKDGEGEDAIVVGYELNLAMHITAEGTYTLTIPQGFFSVTTDEGTYPENYELVATYTVSGLSKILSVIGESADGYNVYTFNGMKVLSSDKAADLTNLPKGFYVINGKKVVIR